ncbi:hypothetical protein RclHR1_10200001 [Rhizophagus clarus]|uniref:Myb/SANT-like DNA-binding domain-containing protein n=1 Tax=Rhizophagus clarus TaxID=94130 RepID=A0A2Z6QF49_9GLOM|nr:hypothetical protein RclHR1_10200001 [Rhizophagus clarus]
MTRIALLRKTLKFKRIKTNNQVIQVLNLHEPVAEWPDDIALILIKQRQRHHQLFENNTHHLDLWTRIANYIRHHHQYEILARQCQVKWYSLKRGYKNLKRLLSRDPDADGYELRNPNWHDCKFYDELSDEFWLRSGDYIYI